MGETEYIDIYVKKPFYFERREMAVWTTGFSPSRNLLFNLQTWETPFMLYVGEKSQRC